VFGISLRSVKAARKYLVEDLHLLIPVEVPHWVRNRYGQKMTLNLQWALPVNETEGQPQVVESAADDAVHKIAPLPAANRFCRKFSFGTHSAMLFYRECGGGGVG
jgi:hypothetical protein